MSGLLRSLITGFLLLAAAAHAAQAADILDYSLKVSFDIPSAKITGVATIPVKKGHELKLYKEALQITEVTLDKQKLDFFSQDETIKISPPRTGMLAIKYRGFFKTSKGNEREARGMIGESGIFLTGAWYPQADQMCIYHLTATLPRGYEAISEAETIHHAAKDGQEIFSFAFPHPLEAINFIATHRYQVVRDHLNHIEIVAYFFREDARLAETYLEHAKEYLKLYERLIGKFPFKRFSIVENFLPTGYSMPTYTLLGQEVVRLPFIVNTSLGHEILHQWFGNLVYVDDRKGNWAEGLTTYLADHLYEEEKGKGFEYRKGALIDYQAYVNDKNEFPLKGFHGRTDFSSKVIGYGKALMVFHMLRKLVGDRVFYDSLRDFAAEMRFKKASWEDIQNTFVRHSRKDLTWFFRQWIEGKGVVELQIENSKLTPRNGTFEISFTVSQKKKVYTIDLPVSFYSNAGKVRRLFHLDQEKNSFTVLLDDPPEKMVADEDYDLARNLWASEFPPVIARLIGDEGAIVALPPSRAEIYEEIIEAFKKRGARVKRAEEISHAELKTSSLVILGVDNPLTETLYGSMTIEGSFGVAMRENPWNRWKVAGIFQGKSPAEVTSAFPKIFHYGKYSSVSFDQGRNISQKIKETSRGMTEELSKEPAAVNVSTLQTLPQVIEQVAEKKIIYVGETHDRFSHHLVQLEIIKALHRKGRKIAIGMEMFQRPFQRALDDYIEGRSGEREFLERTEYFQRWRFDYNLYRSILQFARAAEIPVVALNIQHEVADQVSRGGVESLSSEEKRLVPAQMDFSDDAYKASLQKVFREHQDFPGRRFDFFYQAQILWDETMSESIAAFLLRHPDTQMIVLAGSGHLAFGSGIPRRTARRTGYDYAIVLNDVDVEKDVATFVVYPPSVPFEGSPQLMVFLREENGKVTIRGFAKESVSEKAGLQVGDAFLSIDSNPIRRVDDVKIDLLFRKKGDQVRVKILRQQPLLGEKEMEFGVGLQ